MKLLLNIFLLLILVLGGCICESVSAESSYQYQQIPTQDGSANSISPSLTYPSTSLYVYDGSAVINCYLEFDLSSIPHNSLVTNATLSLYISSTITADGYWGLSMITESWNESTLCWNNKPTYDNNISAFQSVIMWQNATRINIDVTNLAQKMVSAEEQYGIIIMPYGNSTTSRSVIGQSEGAEINRPYLNIIYSNMYYQPEGELVSDMLFGTIVTVLLVTAMNLIGMRGRFLLLQIMAIIGLVFAIPFLWQDIAYYIPLMVVALLVNMAILAKGAL